MDFFAGEEWLELTVDSDYLVSTRGRLYDVRNGRFVPVSQRSHPVPSWSIRDSRQLSMSNNRYVLIARSMLLAFCGPGRDVEYVDGNPLNLTLENLRWSRVLA